MKTYPLIFVSMLAVAALTAPVRAQTAGAQDATPNTPNVPQASTVQEILDAASAKQPNAATPPTPIPTKTPDTKRLGIEKKDIQKTTRFDFQTKLPGQPGADNPDALRTLDQSLEVAYAHNPQILIAFERAVKTNATIAQILGARGPQISGSLTASRLLNSQSGLGGGGVGVTPAQIQNPFTVGLQTVTPGAVPVTLSSGGGTAGSSGGVTATASSTGGTGATAQSGGTSRAAPPTTRQTTGTPVDPGGQDPGTSNPGNNPTTTPTTGGGLFGGSGSNLNQASARIAITQFIDITGILRTAQQIGDLEQALNRLEILRLRQETALTVKNGYYNVLRTAAFVRVNEAAVAQSTEQLRVTQAQKDAGRRVVV